MFTGKAFGGVYANGSPAHLMLQGFQGFNLFFGSGLWYCKGRFAQWNLENQIQ